MAIVAFIAVRSMASNRMELLAASSTGQPAILFPIEVIGEFARIISLSARLFGNVFAGEALLAVMYAITAKIGFLLVPVVVPVVFLFLELLFGTIQALVFAMLTLVYIALAAAHEHGDDSHEDHALAAGDSPTERAYPSAVGD